MYIYMSGLLEQDIHGAGMTMWESYYTSNPSQRGYMQQMWDLQML